MRHLLTGVAAAGLLLTGAAGVRADEKKGDTKVPGVLNFKMKDIEGKEVDLAQYQGKVVLFVNVATLCGNTPQYEGLEAVYEKYKDKGLVVIGVPANEFGKQEPGSDKEILEFCKKEYKVTFPMMSKVVVKGEGITPLYKYLTAKETNPKFGGDVTWNFEKFLVGRNGEVAARFKPSTKPDNKDVVAKIEEELNKK